MRKIAFIIVSLFSLLSNISTAQVRQALISQAEKGDLETIKYLAESSLKGGGSFSKDMQEGFKWMKRAAELGDGEGTTPDEKLGWFWLEKSAKSMYPAGVFKFAMFNHYDKNFEEAYKWFKVANERFNLSETDYYLGIYHFLEIGGTKLPDVFESKVQNMIKAEEYLRRCCANENDVDGDIQCYLIYILYNIKMRN